jgi:hypothetical protein
MRWLAVIMAAALVAACGSSPGTAPSSSAPSTLPTAPGVDYPDWPTYHGDAQRTGYAASLKPVTGSPAPLWNVPLDGAVYGSPVIVDHGVMIVATENDSVYRIAGGNVVWRRQLGAPVPGSSLPCGNIDPSGITSTPAYDPATNTLVVVAFLADPFRHVAVGLDPVTGAQRWSRMVDVPSSVPGTSPRAMQQRGALLVDGRRVYIPYGGLAGDCSSYRGSLVGVDLDHPADPLWYFTVPTAREGGIWAAPGPSANPGGGLLVAVGNGASGSGEPYDYSDSILRLSGQNIVDSFSPTTWAADNEADLDLGSQAPAIVGSRVFADGKSGTAYLLDRAHLGGIGGQLSQTRLCPSYGGTAVVGDVVYVPCTTGVRAVRINADDTMTVLWRAPSNVTGSPVVGAGRVWSLDVDAGRLYMLDAADGAVLGSMATGQVTRFATAALYCNTVLVGTTAGIRAFTW